MAPPPITVHAAVGFLAVSPSQPSRFQPNSSHQLLLARGGSRPSTTTAYHPTIKGRGRVQKESSYRPAANRDGKAWSAGSQKTTGSISMMFPCPFTCSNLSLSLSVKLNGTLPPPPKDSVNHQQGSIMGVAPSSACNVPQQHLAPSTSFVGKRGKQEGGSSSTLLFLQNIHRAKTPRRKSPHHQSFISQPVHPMPLLQNVTMTTKSDMQSPSRPLSPPWTSQTPSITSLFTPGSKSSLPSPSKIVSSSKACLLVSN